MSEQHSIACVSQYGGVCNCAALIAAASAPTLAAENKRLRDAVSEGVKLFSVLKYSRDAWPDIAKIHDCLRAALSQFTGTGAK